MVPAGTSELVQTLPEHHRNVVKTLPSDPHILTGVGAAQPGADVPYQGEHRQAAGSPARPSASSHSHFIWRRPASRTCVPGTPGVPEG